MRLSGAGDYDLYLDLSGLRPAEIADHLERVRRESGLIDGMRRVTVAAPRGLEARALDPSIVVREASTALAEALAAAAAGGRALAVVRGPWQPPNEVVSALVERQRLDPMLGVIQPRFARAEDDRIIGLAADPDAVVLLPRAAVPFLPETVLAPELPAALLVITSEGALAAHPRSRNPADASLAAVLVALRRRGFRTLIANRVIARFPLDWRSAYPLVPPETNPAVAEGLALARRHIAEQPELALEALLAKCFAADGRPRLLLDARGMTTTHNGTSQAIIGYLEGFEALASMEFEITVLAASSAARFHKLEKRFPRLRYRFDRLEESYLAAILLNQLWSVATMIDLHRRALFIVATMLDTISWDVLYPGPDGLDETWRVMARLADGLLFISDFTRQRFSFRFPPDPSIPLVVTHLSVDPKEIARGPLGRAPFAEPYLLVFGNDYDHKAVAPTLASLSDAFPFMRIVALGVDHAASPQVTALKSGALGEGEIDALVGHAAAVIYPSHYEGFGLPVIHGLARGRTVIVRRSALWDEIGGIARLPGRIAPFHDEPSLVRAVGRVVHAATVDGPGNEVCADEAGPPLGWRGCASRVVDLARHLVFSRDGSRWVERHTLVNALARAGRA